MVRSRLVSLSLLLCFGALTEAAREMSLGIYGGSGVTFLHTSLPTRKLNLLYFDGESATLTASGSLDSQTALLREHIELNPSDEFEGLLRDSINLVLRRLCEWEWDLFEWAEEHTTNIFKNPDRVAGKPVSAPTSSDIDRYRDSTTDILNWLGWLTWTDCPSKCDIGVSLLYIK